MESFIARIAGQHRLPIDSRTSVAYLHALIEHNPIAVIVLDSRHKFQMCNPAFERMFQFTTPELETWGLDSMIAGPDFLQEANQLTRRVLSGERVHTLSKRRRKDGLFIDVEIYGVPLIVEERVIGVYGLYQDVTERTEIAAAVQEMTTRLNTVKEEERRRFARDLHDSLSQELALLKWNLRKLGQYISPQTPAMELLEQTRDLAETCVNQIRSASFLLHPPQLGEADLNTAITWLAEGFHQRSGIEVNIDLEHTDVPLTMPVECALYRVVQEGLANVLRHARDSSVEICLRHDGGLLRLTLTNQPSSAVTRAAPPVPHAGVGLAGMQERLTELGGYLEVVPARGGLQIRASVPTSAGVACAS